jgi:hypothetical protein
VYRKAKSADKNYILANLIDVYYTHGCVQATFKRNIYPVSLDTLAYDGETQPPQGTIRSAGRPRTKRVRRRNVYVASEDSPIAQTVVKQDTIRELVQQKRDNALHTNIEEATIELLRIQDKNEKP